MGQLAEVVVSVEEREVLERWARRPSSAQALAFRCRVVLAAAEGKSSSDRSGVGLQLVDGRKVAWAVRSAGAWWAS